MTDLERHLGEALERGVLDQRLIDLRDARNRERFAELQRQHDEVPTEALAAAALLKPGQHLLAKVGDRYFEASS